MDTLRSIHAMAEFLGTDTVKEDTFGFHIFALWTSGSSVCLILVSILSFLFCSLPAYLICVSDTRVALSSNL